MVCVISVNFTSPTANGASGYGEFICITTPAADRASVGGEHVDFTIPAADGVSGCDECVDFNTPPTAGRVCADFQRDQLSPELFVPEGEHAQGTHIPSFSERGVERTSEALTESLDSKDTRMQCMLPAPTSFFPCFSSILALGLMWCLT